ncbi:MAG TPA: hypothetical protein VL916_01585, partial [Ilumatobacteraceae bacterium]|nr:hypothetical protein [Ilumatobacteraceae bacterium]
MELELPAPFTARPYAGPADHAAMADALNDYYAHIGNPERTTLALFDNAYANLVNCEPTRDIALIEDAAGELAGYVRTWWEDLEDGTRDCIVFTPIRGRHASSELFYSAITGAEQHMQSWTRGPTARFVAFTIHPGPGAELTGEPAWLESAGYATIRF